MLIVIDGRDVGFVGAGYIGGAPSPRSVGPTNNLGAGLCTRQSDRYTGAARRPERQRQGVDLISEPQPRLGIVSRSRGAADRGELPGSSLTSASPSRQGSIMSAKAAKNHRVSIRKGLCAHAGKPSRRLHGSGPGADRTRGEDLLHQVACLGESLLTPPGSRKMRPPLHRRAPKISRRGVLHRTSDFDLENEEPSFN